MKQVYSISELADELGIPPRVISDAIYVRRLDEAWLHRAGNRRVVLAADIPRIRAALAQLGKLPAGDAAGRGGEVAAAEERASVVA